MMEVRSLLMKNLHCIIQPQEKKINTFAFELKTEINAHEDNQGWLFGKNYKNTDYYLINWITLPDNVEDKFWWQKDIEIVSVESMLLNKKRIQDFVRDVFRVRMIYLENMTILIT